MALPSLVVFGSQTTWPSDEYLFRVRTALLLEPRLQTFLIAIKELRKTWHVLVESDPRLVKVPGLRALDDIQRWIDCGESPSVSEGLINVLCTPLTIIIHMVQYFKYLDDKTGGATHGQILENVKSGGVQGFCTGFLTAIAVAYSRNEEDLSMFGGTALRLALCIGAYVDLDGAFADPPKETRCIAVRWRSEVSKEEVLETLNAYPDAYISVITDSTSVTVTTSQATADSLMNQLSTRGITTKLVNLQGRFHSAVHGEAVERISKLCISNADLRFPAPEKLLAPLRSNSDAQVISSGSLERIALESILTELANWHLTISSALFQQTHAENRSVLQIGLIDSIPSSIVRELAWKINKIFSPQLYPVDLVGSASASTSGTATPAAPDVQKDRYPEHAIAIVGMACKFPGADSIDEFWELLTSGTSMLEQIPAERFSTTGLRRSPDDALRFWGNFIRDIDAFDHRFFKKSSREAASMDPQQRLLLQVAYEAMESSGYFGELSGAPADDIGCYLGVCAADYNDNVASHPPNAFSSLGTLRAFLSGKISHFFGWTGPSITYDTACSSSAVAIHAACKAIQDGECSRAVAGGVSLYTSPNFYQNLAAASFLSPTGATKPFDAKADGYCRGEGIGLVVLRKLSDAVKNGDTVLGVIAGTAVNQNCNSTAITVPHSPSQIKLYRKVSSLAGIDPMNVSFVEAHGTGTPVGDPIEFESIRKVFGGHQRTTPLHVASVKGNIGHLEGASGVAALIKTVLMMQHKTIPVQANFTKLNPKIAPIEPDRMAIPTATQKWQTTFPAACINNYGAAGSNAAMIVCHAPQETSILASLSLNRQATLEKYPIFISANSPASLIAYCEALRRRLPQISSTGTQDNLPATLAFNLANKQNHSLPHILATTVSDLKDMDSKLAACISGQSVFQSQVPAKTKPVVLVFGGQVSNAVGLSKDAYNASVLLRAHLDCCDAILRSSGLKGLYPQIFQTGPVEDIVNLHGMLFSLQYSCAKSWMDSGLHVDAVLGHSFGQLTALCVSGSLSLSDGLKLVTGRASLMQKHWGPERGSMISLEGDIDTVLRLVSIVNGSGAGHRLEIACYNGPTSHVLVGTESSIQAVQDILTDQSSAIGPMKFRKLNVTHGFHSVFTEPLLPGLTKLAEELVFNEPTIPLETCSEGRSWTQAEPRLIAEHTRTPVYFSQAVDRLTSRLGPCTWLEAGSNSSVTGMVRRALGASASHVFQPVQLSGSGVMETLAETTVNLWKAGYKVQFWPFHRCQKHQYSPLSLPPYQFEKSRHWLTWIDTAQAPPVSGPIVVEAEPSLLSFVKFNGQGQRDAEFNVDPRSKEYNLYVQGHAVLAEPLCPAPLYVELVSRAANMLENNPGSPTPTICVEDLEIKAPLGMNDRAITITMKRVDGTTPTWAFTLSSQTRENLLKKTEKPLQHATGVVRLQSNSTAPLADFARYERLIHFRRYNELMNDPDAEAMQGSLIYKVFGKVVQYADYYKGVRSVYSKDCEVAGHVVLPRHTISALNDNMCNPLAIDNFVQVAGLHVNSLHECGDNEVFVCTKVDQIQLGHKFNPADPDARSWIVYSNFYPTSEKEVVNDIFVFDVAGKNLVLIVLGAHFTKVLISSLAKVLSRANNAQGSTSTGSVISSTSTPGNIPLRSLPVQPDENIQLPAASPPKPKESAASNSTSGSVADISHNLRSLLNKVTDVPVNDINLDSTYEELGIDSLMVTEVLSEIRKAFEVDIPLDDFQNLPDIKSTCEYLLSKGCGSHGDSLAEDAACSSSASSVSPTPRSAGTGATSVSDMPLSDDTAISKLAKLVAGHLETTVTMSRETNLADQGLDSLLSIELASDIKKIFGVEVDMAQLNISSTFGDLSDMVMSQQTVFTQSTSSAPTKVAPQTSAPPVKISPESARTDTPALTHAQQAFEEIRYNYDVFTKQTGFANFWRDVYPTQARLVLAYVVEAFAALGSSLASLKPGERVPNVKFLPKHAMEVAQLKEILKDAALVSFEGDNMVRSAKPIDSTPSVTIYQDILRKFPQHASEHKLLHITGSRLADCLTGAADPLQLLFRSKENKELLEDVYTNGPMYEAITKLLGSFLVKAFKNPSGGGKFRILELGGGTGGTTKYIVDFLARQGIPFSYTFSDLSGSLVAAARKKFAGLDFMDFMVLDIEKAPPEKFASRFHTIISTNCIHATRNLEVSTTNIRKMLRPDGFVALVEFTRNIFWFDLVFGLLDGWWLFEDGRPHVLTSEWFWDKSMRNAGFKHVTWSDGSSEEARTLRIITGFLAEAEKASFKPTKALSQPKVRMETVVYKQVGQLSLCADIYYPVEVSQTKRPIALMIHGGGHVMLSRNDIRPKQTQLLLDNGLLPVSIDYRLCPEVNLIQGPMVDVCDALRWAREKLPTLNLKCPGLQIDGDKVVVVGWSTGGHLATTLSWTARQQNLKPPEAILAFYCPTDYEAEWWQKPIFPESSEAASREDYDLLEGVKDEPITSYNVPTNHRAVGGWMSFSDPRSRIVLHMNWKGQALPVLLRGLPSKNKASGTDPKKWHSLDQPPHEDIITVSPYAQIIRDNYRTPTFFIHGTADDLIPWQQTQQVHDALVSKGVRAGLSILDGAVHLFDIYRDVDPKCWEAVLAGYEFLFSHVR